MASGLLMAAQQDGPYFFNATETPPAIVAESISDWFQVPVLVHESVQKKTVTGRMWGTNVNDVLTSFSFLLGCKFRLDSSRSVYVVGGDSVKVISQFPSYGLSAQDVSLISRDGARLVADRIVVEEDESRTKQISDVIETFRSRQSVVLELFLLDTSDSQAARVNEWLDQVKIGAGMVAQSAFVTAAPQAGAAQTFQRLSKHGPEYDVQVRGLLELIERDRNSRLELRQQIQVLSGSESMFSSGEIIERPIILREPETGKDLVSRYDRRTVGLQLRLKAVSLPAGWSLKVDMEDSNFVSDREKTTKVTMERILKPGAGMTLLASFTRSSSETLHRGVPILSKMGRLGKRLFETTANSSGNRAVMLLVREVASK